MSRILAISGSLRAQSSNSRVIAALALVAPPGVEVVVATGLGDLPHFNPDLDVEPPPAAVAAWRDQVMGADGLILCSPEYAHGVAGVMKNGLDWLVSVVGLQERPVGLINAAPRAHHAVAHMRENLQTMFTDLPDGAWVTLPQMTRPMTAEEIAADAGLAAVLRGALEGLVGRA